MAKGWILRAAFPVMPNDGWSEPNASVYFVPGGGLTSVLSGAHVFGAHHEAEYARDRWYGYHFDIVPLDQAEAEYVAQKINE